MGKKTMEDRPYPDEKVGSKYRVVGHDDIEIGTIVYLSVNDDSSCPYFTADLNSGGSACLWWHNLEKIVKKNVIGGELIEANPIKQTKERL